MFSLKSIKTGLKTNYQFKLICYKSWLAGLDCSAINCGCNNGKLIGRVKPLMDKDYIFLVEGKHLATYNLIKEKQGRQLSISRINIHFWIELLWNLKSQLIKIGNVKSSGRKNQSNHWQRSWHIWTFFGLI